MFLHFLKVKFASGLSLGFVVDGFLGNHAPVREGAFCCIQPVGPFLRLFDIRGQFRGGPFLGGKLQSGGRAAGFLCHTLSMPGRLLCLMPVADVHSPFQRLFRCTIRLGRVFRFGLPAGNVHALAGGLVVQCKPSAGHALRHLITGF